jgi:hypothetical protein
VPATAAVLHAVSAARCSIWRRGTAGWLLLAVLLLWLLAAASCVSRLLAAASVACLEWAAACDLVTWRREWPRTLLLGRSSMLVEVRAPNG